MNLKLEKEFKEINNTPWYRITADGRYIDGSHDFETIKKVYEKIKANPELLKNEREILLSEEI